MNCHNLVRVRETTKVEVCQDRSEHALIESQELFVVS